MQDATEIKVRKTDYHVMCTVTGNMTHDILTLKVNDLTSLKLIYFFCYYREIKVPKKVLLDTSVEFQVASVHM